MGRGGGADSRDQFQPAPQPSLHKLGGPGEDQCTAHCDRHTQKANEEESGRAPKRTWWQGIARLPAHPMLRGVAPRGVFAVRIAAEIRDQPCLGVICRRAAVLVGGLAVPGLAQPPAAGPGLTPTIIGPVATERFVAPLQRRNNA